MTLTLDLPNEIAAAITEAAHRQGRSREDLAVGALDLLRNWCILTACSMPT